MLRYLGWKPSARICWMKPIMICAASRKMSTLVIVEPRWLCTPASSSSGSSLILFKNHCARKINNCQCKMKC